MRKNIPDRFAESFHKDPAPESTGPGLRFDHAEWTALHTLSGRADSLIGAERTAASFSDRPAPEPPDRRVGAIGKDGV